MPSRRARAKRRSARGAERAGPRADLKIQRWVDLLAALLMRRFPVTFEEIAREVPGYRSHGAQPASVMRTFERDKDELRAFGVPIETVEDRDDSANTGYKLATREFYLPYLCLRAASGRQSSPRRVGDLGYRALGDLVFDADELEAVQRAGEIVMSLGDPSLAEEAASAMRKLAFDLPMEGMRLFRLSARAAVEAVDEEEALRPRSAWISRVARPFLGPEPLAAAPRGAEPPRDHFTQLNEAVLRRKSVRFTYFSMHSGETRERRAEPYGLFFTNGQWYLAARDVASGDVKSFRLGRLTRLEVSATRPLTPDYEIPADFHLAEYARARHPWELGDGDAMSVMVEFTGESGAAAAAARLGTPVRGAAGRRTFEVRRPDAFARWLLSFGGDAKVVSPPLVREEFASQLERTLAAYGGADA